MTSPIDDLFARITELSDAIAALDADDPRAGELVSERDRLRAEAERMAADGRHPLSVELEIQAIEDRLAAIERLKITQGYQEKRGGRNIQDPGAYSATINRLLDEQHADEVAHLEKRLERLRSIKDGG